MAEKKGAGGKPQTYDELGRYSQMTTGELRARQMHFLENNSGAKSGALDSNSDRALKHAELMYETYRNSKGDIPKIAKLTGYPEQEISEIKQYVFNNSEFTPDYDQAQTWDRLRKGEPIEADIIFIKHELMEMEYRKQGYSYREAHEMTQKVYNYQTAIEEYKNVANKKKRNNQG